MSIVRIWRHGRQEDAHLLTLAKWIILPGRPSSTDCSCRRFQIKSLKRPMLRLKGVSGSWPGGYMRSCASNSLKIACMIIILFTRAREIASSTSLRRRHKERKLRRGTRSLPNTTVVMNVEKSIFKKIMISGQQTCGKIFCLAHLCRTFCPRRSRVCRKRSSEEWGSCYAG